MKLTFESDKKADFPFEIVIQVEGFDNQNKSPQEWAFSFDWINQIGRDKTKLKKVSETVTHAAKSSADDPAHIVCNVKGTVELDLGSLGDDFSNVCIGDVYLALPGEKKVKLTQKTPFSWGRSGRLALKGVK